MAAEARRGRARRYQTKGGGQIPYPCNFFRSQRGASSLVERVLLSPQLSPPSLPSSALHPYLPGRVLRAREGGVGRGRGERRASRFEREHPSSTRLAHVGDWKTALCHKAQTQRSRNALNPPPLPFPLSHRSFTDPWPLQCTWLSSRVMCGSTPWGQGRP